MLVLIDNYFPWFGDMLELGGNILLIIILLAAVMWSLIIERLIYLWFVYPRKLQIALELWRQQYGKNEFVQTEYRKLIISRIEG
ncbi:MAG: hypothetical protein HKN08_00905, partial [Gammaproteobacteria bacterium]|nr:hypothetical protein [Gammaproteobacteria bacterium]